MENKHDLTQYDRFLREELTPSRAGGKGKYICPLCGSGARQGGTGALSVFTRDDGREAFSCFSCLEKGDIFDLVAKRDGLSLQDATRAVIAKYGNLTGYASAVSVSRAAPAGETSATADRKKADDQQLNQIRQFVSECHAALKGSEAYSYFKSRGLTDESIQRFRLGYDQGRRRATIPYGDGSFYTGRTLLPVSDTNHKYYNPEGKHTILFNADALYSDKPCFIVESAMCAISIEQSGGKAVALSGTSGPNLLLNQIKRQTPTAPVLVVSLDNETDPKKIETVNKVADYLIANLEKEGLYVVRRNISGDKHDPNELLAANPAALAANIAIVSREIEAERDAAKKEAEAEEERKRSEYIASSVKSAIPDFLGGVKESASTPAIPTGFHDLDARLDGGLYEGLYILGAISSLGKTSFVIQIADQIAKAGHHVLYFSLEMARSELMAKSISRLTYSISKAKGKGNSLAKTTRGILAGKKYAAYTREELETISEAVDQYEDNVSANLWVFEGVGDIGVQDIRAAVERHIKYTGRRPVVVIDYLQIMSPIEIKASDKQNVDRAVLELKRISRDMKTPIIAISSLNRESYNEPIAMTSFKESDSIEFSSDVLIGLQYKGMDYQPGESDKSRSSRLREERDSREASVAKGKGVEIELKLLKNRNGSRGFASEFTFYPPFNTFVEHAYDWKETKDPTPFDKSTKKRAI